MKIKHTSVTLSVVATMAGLSQSAFAAPITWDGAGDGTTYEDGGNWGGVAPSDDLATDVATLTGGTVDLSTVRQVSGLDFSSGSTLSGAGSIELGADGIDVGANSVLNTAGLVLNQPNTTITFAGGRLSWGTGLTASGTGALTLTGNNTLFVDGGANTFAGGTTITGGATASLKNAGALGSGAVTLDNGTLAANGTNFGWANAITVNAGGGTVNTKGDLSGAISGAGALTVIGDGSEHTWTSDASAYTGDLILDNAFFRQRNNDGFGSGTITLKNNGIIKNHNNNRILTLNNNIIVDTTGGAIEAGWNGPGNGHGVILNGAISGAGQLTVRDDSGVVRFSNGNTYAGGTVIYGSARAVSGGFGTGTVTLDGSGAERGKIQNNGGGSTHANDFIISSANAGGRMKAGWNQDLEITGVVSDSGTLTIEGDSGNVVLSNSANTFTGDIVLDATNSNLTVASLASGSGGEYASVISGDGNLTITGDIDLEGANTLTGDVIVTSTGIIGGDGSLAGDLILQAGAKWDFDAAETLTVAGAVTLDATFGVDDLVGVAGTADGTYTLIDGTATLFASLGIENWGIANAYDFGDGHCAYFEEGSLDLVIYSHPVPEPTTTGLLGLGGLALILRRRK